MAKTSWVERNNRKAATVKKYAALRAVQASMLSWAAVFLRTFTRKTKVL